MARRRSGIDPDLAHAYYMTFSTDTGRRVLYHLVDTIYCSVYEGTDSVAAVCHNARRTVVEEILFNIDLGEHPDKHKIVEEHHAFGPDTPSPAS